MAYHNDLGKKGEEVAVNYLQQKGYKILKRNYRYLKAEVDIIAKLEGLIIAVEVKTRTTDYFGSPQSFINKKKVQLLTNAMDRFIKDNNFDAEVRFDIIAVLVKTTFIVTHIEDAFFHY